MGVLNGQTANQDTFNNAFLDKNADTVMPNKISMTDPDEGGDIDSVQGSLNEIFDTQGTSEGDANAKVYANTNYIADGDSQKTAIEKLDAQAGISDGDLTNHVADLTAHRNFDTLANLTTWATTASNGWFGFATDTKQSFQVIDGALEPIGGGGGLNYLGTWDASTNTPSLPIGDEENGDFYVVDVAGTQDIGNGSVDWAVGDWAIYNDLTGFLKIDNSELVSSVNGQTGAVVLDADDISETTSRYWDVKNNRTATTNPTVANDDSENYAQGSTWLNTSTGTMYVCTDASTNAAVWKIQSGSDSKNTRWGNINRNTIASSDWVTTGDAAVTDSSIDGSIQDSFRVDTGTAGNTAEIEHIIPPSAIDVRYNQAVIEYQLFDITDPVTCKVLDWDNNIIGQVELMQTGSAPAVADNIRFSHATVDFSFPFSHGSLIRSVKFRFECASDISAGQFLVNFIQSDSNPRSIGQWVEVNEAGGTNSVSSNNITTTNPATFPNFYGKGFNGTTYIGQKTGSEIKFVIAVRQSSAQTSSNLEVRRDGVPLDIPATMQGDSTTGQRSGVIIVPPSMSIAGSSYDIVTRLGTMNQGVTGMEPRDNSITITETVNRRSIMSEVDVGWKTYSPVVQGYSVPSENMRYVDTGNGYIFISGFINTGTRDANMVQIGLPDGYTCNTNGATDVPVSGVMWGGGSASGTYSAILTEGDSYFGLGFSGNASGSDVRYNGNGLLADNSNIYFSLAIPVNETGFKQIISIPVDEIIADGNEYAVFGKFITVGGVKYQVYRRAYVDSGSGTVDTLPTTYRPINGRRTTATIFVLNNNAAVSTSYIQELFDISSGELTVITGGGYSRQAGDIILMDYYDTAKPYYG